EKVLRCRSRRLSRVWLSPDRSSHNLSRILVHCFRYVGSISDDTHSVTCLLSSTLETGGGWGNAFLNSVFFCECLVGEILRSFLGLSNDRARIPRNTHPCDNTSKDFGA